MKARRIRRVASLHKIGPLSGQPKTASDSKTRTTVERIRATQRKQCDARWCIWDGVIRKGSYFARVRSDGDTKKIGGRTVIQDRDYHFSCLPQSAMYLRRFFEVLPWRQTLCVGGDIVAADGAAQHRPRYMHTYGGRCFASIEEWEAWMATHYPSMRRNWRKQWTDIDGMIRVQHGTGHNWCMLQRRNGF